MSCPVFLIIIISGTVDNPCFIVPLDPVPTQEQIENPAAVFTLPELSIVPIPVELASLVNAVPAFQHQSTMFVPEPWSEPPLIVKPSLSKLAN